MSTPEPRNEWSRIYEDVKMQIPGLTDAVMKQMTYQVLDDFFDRTNIWIEEVPVAVGPDSLTYSFAVVDQGWPNRLMLVYDPLQGSGNEKRWAQQGIEMYKPGVITLRYAPSSATTWNVVVAKVLDTVGSEGWPDVGGGSWIVDRYGDGIHFGVLGRLQGMPGKPYSNAKLGAQNWQVYVTERGKARTDALKSNVFGGQRWQYPQAFATVRRGGWT